MSVLYVVHYINPSFEAYNLQKNHTASLPIIIDESFRILKYGQFDFTVSELIIANNLN